MKKFVELVIPMDRSWLLMLDTIALPVIQNLPAEAHYFFTNDSNKVMRLRIEESSFEIHKKEIYPVLLDRLQSGQKVKVYAQNYLIEEARFGKVSNLSFHSNLFFRASSIMISLLEEAEHIDQYETRMPYVVIAIHYLLKQLSDSEQSNLATLYIKHWMYFNEEESYTKLVEDFGITYEDEIQSLSILLKSLDQQKQIQALFAEWENECIHFAQSFQSLEKIAESSHRQEAYYYKSNKLEHPRKWEVFADHVHLLMNRFGMQNEDETLLMFLTFSAMKVG